MTLDRERRRLAADALATFMRGEVTNLQFHNRISEIIRSAYGNSDIPRDETILQCVLNPDWWPKDRVEHHVSVGQKTWEEMRRALALLESDLEIRYEDAGRTREMPWSESLMMIALYLVIVALYVAFCGLNIGLFPVAWFSPLFCSLIAQGTGKQRGTSDLELSSYPFSSDEQWQANRHRLERFQLPNWETEAHDQPVRQSTNFFVLLVSAPAAIVFLIFVVLASPFSMLAMFIKSPTKKRVVA